MRRPSWRTAVIVGVLCGLFGVVLVRIGIALLLGGVRVLAVLAVGGLVWAVVRGLRPPRRG